MLAGDLPKRTLPFMYNAVPWDLHPYMYVALTVHYVRCSYRVHHIPYRVLFFLFFYILRM